MRITARMVRDGLVFMLGMTGIVQQTFFAHTVQSPLLILFAGMVGLPSMLHIDAISFGGTGKQPPSGGTKP